MQKPRIVLRGFFVCSLSIVKVIDDSVLQMRLTKQSILNWVEVNQQVQAQAQNT